MNDYKLGDIEDLRDEANDDMNKDRERETVPQAVTTTRTGKRRKRKATDERER